MRRPYRFNKRNPQPRAVCDRCGVQVARKDLFEQKDFRGGDAPVDTGILVCIECNDKPQPFFSRNQTKQDPQPVPNPRPSNIT